MNEKIKAILLKIVIALKKQGWVLDKDYELTLQSDGHIPIHTNIPVEGAIGDKEHSDQLEVDLFLKLGTHDQITFYPEYEISAELFIQGGNIDRVSNVLDADVPFIEEDFRNEQKIALAAQKINDDATSQMQSEYDNYIKNNTNDIHQYNSGGWKADDDAYGDR